MTWLTWRQFRTQALATAIALAVFFVILLITGIQVRHLYDTSAVPGCGALHDCQRAAGSYLNGLKNNNVYFLLFDGGVALSYLVPAVIGVFWGAPLLAREFEAGTLSVAWNQSVSRARWLATKLAIVGFASMATAGLLSLMEGWWASPIEAAAGDAQGAGVTTRFAPLLFGARGITPIGYAAFAFALGVALGVVFRRTLPAMAVTLVVFAAVQIVMPVVVRPHLIAPVQHTTALNTAAIQGLSVTNGGHMTVFAQVNEPNAWMLSNTTLTSAAQPFHGSAPAACRSPNAPFSQCQASIQKLDLLVRVTYQPISRYWDFQGIETALFAVLAGLLAWFSWWWVRRRRIA